MKTSKGGWNRSGNVQTMTDRQRAILSSSNDAHNAAPESDKIGIGCHCTECGERV